MIIEAVVSLLRTVVTAVLALLPTVEVEPWDIGSWSVAGGLVDAVFPWSSIRTALGVLVGWIVICHTYRLVLWVLGVLHISGDGG